MPAFVITNIGNAGLYDSSTGNMVAVLDKLDQIQLTIDSKLTETYGGSSPYPLTNIMSDRKPVVDLKGLEVNLGAYYRMLGATNTAAASGSPIQVPVIETYVIPSGASVTLNHTPSTVNTTITVMGVLTDTVFTKVASAPTQGQYSITGNTLTFNSSDVGTSVYVAYDYDTTTGGNIQVKTTSFPGTYTFKASGKYFQSVNDPSKPMYDIAMVIKSCQLTGNLIVNMERSKATAQNMQLSILDPGPAFNPIEIRTSAAYA